MIVSRIHQYITVPVYQNHEIIPQSGHRIADHEAYPIYAFSELAL
jgi:hypothetical protein